MKNGTSLWVGLAMIGGALALSTGALAARKPTTKQKFLVGDTVTVNDNSVLITYAQFTANGWVYTGIATEPTGNKVSGYKFAENEATLTGVEL